MVWEQDSIINHLMFEGDIYHLYITAKNKISRFDQPSFVHLNISIYKLIENTEIFSDTLELSCFLESKTYCIIKYLKNLSDCFYKEVIDMLNELHYYVWGIK